MSKRTKLMLLIFAIFIVWMTFFDENSFLNRRKLNTEINELESKNAYYKSEIKKDKKMINDLNNADSLEKFAREAYKMKRKDEEIFLIEFDSVK